MKKIDFDEMKAAIKKSLLPGHGLAMVHSSIGMFGAINDPVESCIKAWTEACDDTGYTIAMPTFTWSYCRTRMYHYRDTVAETGILPDSFRKQQKVIRGEHPIFSFAGYGPKAENLVAHHGATCWGADTPFDYLLKNNGILVMFGVGWEYLTFYHHIEEMNLVPYHYWKRFKGKADYGQGMVDCAPQYRVRSLRLTSGSSFHLIHDTLEKQGKMTVIPLGDGYIKALSARDIYALGCELVRNDPYVFLKDKNAYMEEVKRPFFVFLGDSNLDLLTAEMEKVFTESLGRKCRTLKVPFGQYRQQFVDADSDLRLEKPDYLVFAQRAEDIFGDDFNEIEKIHDYIAFIQQCRTLVSGTFFVFDLLGLGGADSYSSKQDDEFLAKANDLLAQGLKDLKDVHILSYSKAVKAIGRDAARAEKYWYIGRVPFSAGLNKKLSLLVIGAYLFLEGKTVRLIITDLDNTVWGGVIGEDSISGIQLGSDHPGNCFVAYQKMLKRMKGKGKILAVASKNTHAIAVEAIEKHPEMVLSCDDFVSLKINWEDKAGNIQAICDELNLGLSSVCFIDDNPVEREGIRKYLPQVFVPEMPKDPAQWVEFLQALPQFEILSLTQEDKVKTERYTQRLSVQKNKDNFASIDDFYRDMQMKVTFQSMSSLNQARILQLLAKTNQFNTTTRRYKEAELQTIIAAGGLVVGVGLEDRFGSFEIIGVLVLSDFYNSKDFMQIDDLLLSCRVLGRDLERCLLGWVFQMAVKQKKSIIKGQVIFTDKNIPVRDVYAKHGFTSGADNWFILDITKSEIRIPDYFTICDEVNVI